MALLSTGSSDDKHLLVYWIVYGLFNWIESVGYGLFTLFFFGIDCFRLCVLYSSTFYWLTKCLFMIWFLNCGSHMISRWLVKDTDIPTQNTETIVQDTDKPSDNIESAYNCVISMNTLSIKFLIK